MSLFIWMLFLCQLSLLVLSIGSSGIAYNLFQVWTPSPTALSFFRFVLGYSGHICFLTNWQTSWDPVLSSCLVTEANCYGPSGFGQKPSFESMAMPNFTSCSMSFKVTCWLCTILQLIYFFPFIFLFQCSTSFRKYLTCSRVWCLCAFLFLMWLLLPMLAPSSEFIFSWFWASHILLWYLVLFYVQGAYYLVRPPSCCTHSCCIKRPLGCLVRQLPNIWAIALLKLICVNEGGTASLFLSRLACCILNLLNKQGISFQHTYPPILMWKLFLPGKVGSGVASASLHSSGCLSSLRSTWGGSVNILMYQSMLAILHLGKSTTSGSLGVECFQSPFDIYRELCVSPSCIGFPLLCQVSGRTCHR